MRAPCGRVRWAHLGALGAETVRVVTEGGGSSPLATTQAGGATKPGTLGAARPHDRCTHAAEAAALDFSAFGPRELGGRRHAVDRRQYR